MNVPQLSFFLCGLPSHMVSTKKLIMKIKEHDLLSNLLFLCFMYTCSSMSMKTTVALLFLNVFYWSIACWANSKSGRDLTLLQLWGLWQPCSCQPSGRCCIYMSYLSPCILSDHIYHWNTPHYELEMKYNCFHGFCPIIPVYFGQVKVACLSII